jgi:rare lipoprotein A
LWRKTFLFSNICQFLFTLLNKKMIRNTFGWLTALFCTISLVAQAQTETGIITYYNDNMQGKPTASGELYDWQKYTASHKTLPLGTMVKVTNMKNGQSVMVKVNDRHISGTNMLSLARGAAQVIDLVRYGKVTAQLEVTAPANPALAKTNPIANPNPVAQNLTASTNRALGAQPEAQPNVAQTQAQQLLASTSGRKRQVLGFYDANFAKAQPTGHGVRLASFAEAKGATELCKRLQAQGNKDTYIQVLIETDASNTKTGQEYRVVVGQGTETLMQQNFVPYFKAQGFANCMVVSYE